jgi:hypothetical protein
MYPVHRVRGDDESVVVQISWLPHEADTNFEIHASVRLIEFEWPVVIEAVGIEPVSRDDPGISDCTLKGCFLSCHESPRTLDDDMLTPMIFIETDGATDWILATKNVRHRRSSSCQLGSGTG